MAVLEGVEFKQRKKATKQIRTIEDIKGNYSDAEHYKSIENNLKHLNSLREDFEKLNSIYKDNQKWWLTAFSKINSTSKKHRDHENNLSPDFRTNESKLRLVESPKP